MKKILVTGGAGFIGLALTRKLLAEGAEVTILDNFSPQIHNNDQLPDDIAPHVELVRADIRDRTAVSGALRQAEGVVHLAAETGTGQSMYDVDHYFAVNVGATAQLLDILVKDKPTDHLQSLVVASSRAVYGEGAYQCADHGLVYPEARTREHMAAGQFDPLCPHCQRPASVVKTSEQAPFAPMSFYGLTKQVQEQAILLFARTWGINGFGLRYQNVYGPGQSLQNPYTGILAIFSNLARQNAKIEVYEDGLESRDFVFIDDIAEATLRALLHKGDFVGALNVGSGIGTPVIDIARKVVNYFGADSAVEVNGAFRLGDIRHNIADMDQLRALLNFTPSVDFDTGLKQFLDWAAGQEASTAAGYSKSVDELMRHGLMVRKDNDG